MTSLSESAILPATPVQFSGSRTEKSPALKRASVCSNRSVSSSVEMAALVTILLCPPAADVRMWVPVTPTTCQRSYQHSLRVNLAATALSGGMASDRLVPEPPFPRLNFQKPGHRTDRISTSLLFRYGPAYKCLT